MNKENSFTQSVDGYKDLLEDPYQVEAELKNELFCECNFVSLSELRKIARSGTEIDFTTALEALGVGTGCGSCLKYNKVANLYLNFQK